MARKRKTARLEIDAKPAGRADTAPADRIGERLEAAWRVATGATEPPVVDVSAATVDGWVPVVGPDVPPIDDVRVDEPGESAGVDHSGVDIEPVTSPNDVESYAVESYAAESSDPPPMPIDASRPTDELTQSGGADVLSEDGWWATLRTSPPIMGHAGDERSSLDVQRDFSAEWDAKVADEEAREAEDVAVESVDDPPAEYPVDLVPGDGAGVGDVGTHSVVGDTWNDWSSTDHQIDELTTSDAPARDAEVMDVSDDADALAAAESVEVLGDTDGPAVAWVDVVQLAHELRDQVDEVDIAQRRFFDGLDQWRHEVSLDVARIRDSLQMLPPDPTQPSGS